MTLSPSTSTTSKSGIPLRVSRLHREPLLPQRVTSSKPCKDDSITPTLGLQEVKMIIFGHILAFGTMEGDVCGVTSEENRATLMSPSSPVTPPVRQGGLCPNCEFEGARRYSTPRGENETTLGRGCRTFPGKRGPRQRRHRKGESLSRVGQVGGGSAPVGKGTRGSEIRTAVRSGSLSTAPDARSPRGRAGHFRGGTKDI